MKKAPPHASPRPCLNPCPALIRSVSSSPLQLRSGTHSTGSCRDCCTPAHTKLRHRRQGTEYQRALHCLQGVQTCTEKKPSASRKKDVSICKARIKKPPNHSILQSTCVLPLLLRPSLNRAKSSKERSYTRVSKLDRQP